MITVDQAIMRVFDFASPISKSGLVLIDDAVGKVLSKDLIAPLSLPAFRQSAMDGYAINLSYKDSYKVIGEVKAGDMESVEVQPGEAIRIFTGAKVPDSCNSMVIQERVKREGDQIHLEITPKEGDNIRGIGGQIMEGAVTLSKGHQINPSSIGLIKSLGIQEVEVVKELKAAVVVTGNELVEAGKELKEGQIYESNSSVIAAALKAKGITSISKITVKDNLEDTIDQLGRALEENDLLLISGGISVGEYDFVGRALKTLEVEEVFYRVQQKPGKPLFFGRKQDKYVFALPGNPASTLTCFYIYVTLLVDLISGVKNPGLLRVKMPIAQTYANPFGRALFLKARISNNQVEVLDHQASSTMISFAEANALAYVPADQKEIAAGDSIETIILPYGS